MKALLVVLALVAVSANAKLKLEQKIEPIYMSAQGQQLSGTEAMQASIQGQKVLKCQEVEYTVKSTGSGSFKAKK